MIALLPLFRADLRVPVDPVVMASDASLTGGAIFRSMGLTARATFGDLKASPNAKNKFG